MKVRMQNEGITIFKITRRKCLLSNIQIIYSVNKYQLSGKIVKNHVKKSEQNKKQKSNGNFNAFSYEEVADH